MVSLEWRNIDHALFRCSQTNCHLGSTEFFLLCFSYPWPLSTALHIVLRRATDIKIESTCCTLLSAHIKEAAPDNPRAIVCTLPGQSWVLSRYEKKDLLPTSMALCFPGTQAQTLQSLSPNSPNSFSSTFILHLLQATLPTNTISH